MGNICSILVSKDGKFMEECIAWAEEAKIKNICKSRRSHLNFSLNFEGYLQVLAFFTDDICRAEYCVLEDLPKVANFCLRKQTEKDLEASTSTVCAGWAGTNDQAQFVVPLPLELGPLKVHFYSCRRWIEEARSHHSIRGLDPVFLECVGRPTARRAFQLAQKTELVKIFFSRTVFFIGK